MTVNDVLRSMLSRCPRLALALVSFALVVPPSAQAVLPNGPSSAPTISPNGSYIAFASDASNLVQEDTNGVADVFVRDLGTGDVRRVSVNAQGQQANDASASPSISDDGRYVAFESYAQNLVSGDTNNAWDVFVRDRATNVTERVSVASGGTQGDQHSRAPALSGDGKRVVFESQATNLDPA